MRVHVCCGILPCMRKVHAGKRQGIFFPDLSINPGIIYSLKLHVHFADRLLNFKSMSQTATKLSVIGLFLVCKVSSIMSV